MSTHFEGNLPSTVQFTSKDYRTRHNGDDVRRAMLDLGRIEEHVLVLPSGTEIAKTMGLRVSGLAAIGSRLDYHTLTDTLSAAAGCPVRPVNGYIVDLSYLPEVVTNDSLESASRGAVFSHVAVASYVAARMDNTALMQRLADDIVRQSSPAEAIAFAQRLLGAAASAITATQLDSNP